MRAGRGAAGPRGAPGTRRCRGDQAAAGARPSPQGHERRIAVHHLDIGGRHAQRIRRHLGEDRRGALAVR